VKELRGDIKEREKKINELRVQLEHEEFNISALKRDLDNKDIKINSQDKQFNSKMEQLNERISQFQELLKSERQNKEMWIAKFEKEQKQNSDNSNNILVITNTIKDKELMIRDLNIKYESLQRTNEYIQQVSIQI
jgi:phosphoglycerol transferase MdoB-like AlkP superfamily enzyme